MTPAITIIQDFPAAMGIHAAASYFSVSESQFSKIVRTYPDRLRGFNLLPNGELCWARADLDAFLEWRKSIGVQREDKRSA